MKKAAIITLALSLAMIVSGSFLANAQEIRMPSGVDEADRLAAEYFRKYSSGMEQMLVFNGELHNVSIGSTEKSVGCDADKLSSIIKAGKPLIFFHNHPAIGTILMYPSYMDFGNATHLLFQVKTESPDLPVDFRVMVPDKETSSVSYGLRRPALKEIEKISREYRKLMEAKKRSALKKRENLQLEKKIEFVKLRQIALIFKMQRESSQKYLDFICPPDIKGENAGSCEIHPRNFSYPSEKFFIHYRGTVTE